MQLSDRESGPPPAFDFQLNHNQVWAAFPEAAARDVPHATQPSQVTSTSRRSGDPAYIACLVIWLHVRN